MPAIIHPPSDKLTKLKLFLEKTKTEFSSENQELMPWIKDRGLIIEQLSYSNDQIQQQVIDTDSVEKELIQQLKNNKDNQLASNVTKEEYESIMEKMIQLLQLPAGQLEEKSELYLEQQLSDILGFDVLANFEGNRLLFSTGIMESHPHLKRSPTDSLNKHSNYHEAGISKIRSAFGWFSNSSEISKIDNENEKYYISIPLYYHHNWNTHYYELKQWYRFRKVIVINPNNRIAVVASIGNIGPNTHTRRQFGGSPELIRAGKIWSSAGMGRVLIMFVDDPNNEVSLGPINFDKVFEIK